MYMCCICTVRIWCIQCHRERETQRDKEGEREPGKITKDPTHICIDIIVFHRNIIGVCIYATIYMYM